MISKQAYRQARKTLRGNGNYGMRWLAMDVRMVMSTLQRQKGDVLVHRIMARKGPDGFSTKQSIRALPLL